ncbi:MAG TPA: hypothetical protein VL793_00940, partial [Patescibacteria group bacterium]|nr:hypothetical protein [Patescibacteria group bacterium]
RRWTGAKEQAGIVFANGRRTQQVENGLRWFGLKTHAHQVHLDADLEMHGSMRGYVGLCRLPEGGVNVCGLFRARRGAVPNNPKDLLRGENGTALHDRLARAVFDEDSFCSVAGLSLRPQRAIKDAECRLGDALTMIPPVTGNGMSMALESADIAVEPISQFAHGQITWEAARSAIAQGCDARFRTRLFWAKWLQMLILCRAAHGPMAKWVLNSAALWRLFFALTR